MKTLAIIGTGIAGLGCAHKLQHQYDLTLFEQAAYVGGHSNTVLINEDTPAGRRTVPIDTGFMVFNHETYPELTRLFNELEVPTQPTDMSFSLQYQVDNPSRPLEWAGAKLTQIFGQKRNLLNPRFWRFLRDLNRFNTEGRALMEKLGPEGAKRDPDLVGLTMKDWLKAKGFGPDLLRWYVVPMGSAIWSTPPGKMLDFPARTLLWFFYNHGFLGRTTQHPWYTVTGGSRMYVEKLTAPFRSRIRTRNPVVRVEKLPEGQQITLDNGAQHTFDAVILACHADQALTMLGDPDDLERELLSPFSYQTNRATLHNDASVMPKSRGCWAAWNYQINPMGMASTHYWMNKLQDVSEHQPYFVTISDPDLSVPVGPEHVLKELMYEHPIFSLDAMRAQERLPELNRRLTGRYFCGSYFRYGFHEDALMSALALSDILSEPSL